MASALLSAARPELRDAHISRRDTSGILSDLNPACAEMIFHALSTQESALSSGTMQLHLDINQRDVPAILQALTDIARVEISKSSRTLDGVADSKERIDLALQALRIIGTQSQAVQLLNPEQREKFSLDLVELVKPESKNVVLHELVRTLAKLGPCLGHAISDPLVRSYLLDPLLNRGFAFAALESANPAAAVAVDTLKCLAAQPNFNDLESDELHSKMKKLVPIFDSLLETVPNTDRESITDMLAWAVAHYRNFSPAPDLFSLINLIRDSETRAELDEKPPLAALKEISKELLYLTSLVESDKTDELLNGLKN